MEMFGAVVVGAVTGWFVGYFGARAAVKKYAAAPLLERQVLWNEKALKTIMELRTLAERIPRALRHDNKGLWQSLKMDLNSALIHLEGTVNESVIYADRNIYRQLRDSMSKCRSLTDQLTHAVHESGPSLAGDLYQSLRKELDRALLSLAKPLRERLELEPIRFEDLAMKLPGSAAAADPGIVKPPEKPHD